MEEELRQLVESEAVELGERAGERPLHLPGQLGVHRAERCEARLAIRLEPGVIDDWMRAPGT